MFQHMLPFWIPMLLVTAISYAVALLIQRYTHRSFLDSTIIIAAVCSTLAFFALAAWVGMYLSFGDLEPRPISTGLITGCLSAIVGDIARRCYMWWAQGVRIFASSCSVAPHMIVIGICVMIAFGVDNFDERRLDSQFLEEHQAQDPEFRQLFSLIE